MVSVERVWVVEHLRINLLSGFAWLILFGEYAFSLVDFNVVKGVAF